MTRPATAAVVFDLGGVLIDGNPRHLYRHRFDDPERMEWFLAEVCNDAWNLEQDAGRPFELAIEEAAARHPEWRAMIEAYFDRWSEMLAGADEAAVGVLAELRDRGLELHALTNWSAETFPIARQRFGFLGWFETILVSGEEQLVKPDLRIFYLLARRTGRRPQACVYIDDSRPNVVAAEKVGFDAIHYKDGPTLREEMIERRLLAG
ncbi:MAG: HAD-IA family hydrolase [Geminicoccaceae bacterium]|nr:HAD-IA family hydrolase [Geminicoccaceae bacterium]